MTKDKVVCSKCEGSRQTWLCPKCLGKGELDWIENVVGKRRFYWGDKFWQMVDKDTRVAADSFISRIKSGDIVNIHRHIYKSAKVGD